VLDYAHKFAVLHQFLDICTNLTSSTNALHKHKLLSLTYSPIKFSQVTTRSVQSTCRTRSSPILSP